MGDLLAFLEEIGQAPSGYVGIDALESVVAAAQRRQFKTPADFRLGDVVARPELFLAAGQAEVIVISGTLNTLGEAEFYRTLDHAFAAAGSCLMFNFLSTRHSPAYPPGGESIVRMDPVRVLEHALAMTRKVVLRHDYYDGHDCTMAWFV